MNWLQENKFGPRPLVVVEDHVYHISELLRTIHERSPIVLESLTIVCLDKRGSDTDAAVTEWIEQFPMLQIAFRVFSSDASEFDSNRVCSLSESMFEQQADYCKTLATFVRKHGLLLQDIELESLKFISRERWWESTMLASTIRGIVGEHGPKCAFFSNKRGYEATFGAELLAAGHDPRDVLNKLEMDRIVVPFLKKHLADKFQLELYWCEKRSADNEKRSCLLSDHELEDVSNVLDVVLFPQANSNVRICGLAFEKGKNDSVSLPANGNEAVTWTQLVQARIKASCSANRGATELPGIDVQEIGQRVAPTGALRAESTNAAARHIHSLRKRLIDSQSIVTVEGQYRLNDELSVGMVVKT